MLVNSLVAVAALLSTGVAANANHMEKRTFWGFNGQHSTSCSGGWVAGFGGGTCVNKESVTS